MTPHRPPREPIETEALQLFGISEVLEDVRSS